MEIRDNIVNLSIEASRLDRTTGLMVGVLELIQELKMSVEGAKQSGAEVISIKSVEKLIITTESLMDYGTELLTDINEKIDKETLVMVGISIQVEKAVAPLLESLRLLNE